MNVHVIEKLIPATILCATLNVPTHVHIATNVI